jgi:hypothetical protein
VFPIGLRAHSPMRRLRIRASDPLGPNAIGHHPTGPFWLTKRRERTTERCRGFLGARNICLSGLPLPFETLGSCGVA